jgi:hypothetical protein
MNDSTPIVDEFDPTLTVDQDGRPILSYIDHMSRARRYRDERRPNLRFWHGGFFDWTATSQQRAATIGAVSGIGTETRGSTARH